MNPQRLTGLSPEVIQYLIITANYWAFTLTDGALRMLVVLFFHELGYAPLQIALLFVFYELFGVITNLIGGWLGARLGLKSTMNAGLAFQLIALGMLAVDPSWLSLVWVMIAQALSGIAKDLNKMSAKSAIKLLVPKDQPANLYRWVATLTGSKNTLKGIGFFLGAALLSLYGFQSAIIILLCTLALIWVISLSLLKHELGRSKAKPKLSSILSKTQEVNLLSLARLFLFAARDVWFVIAVPVYLSNQFSWSHWQVGAFMASWVIAYGLVQTQAPKLTHKNTHSRSNGQTVFNWVLSLCLITACIAALIQFTQINAIALIVCLAIFGGVFAVNSSLHSFLIVHYANRDSVSMDVGFYYTANAAGRLLGTVLSGWVYQNYGLAACLWCAALMLMASAAFSSILARKSNL